MEEVKQWVFTICAGTLLCGMISILSPSKSFEKVLGLILGLFLLLCFFTPLRMDAFRFRLDFGEAQELQNRVAEEAHGFFFRAAVEKVQPEIEEQVHQMLERFDVKPDETEIYIEEADRRGGGNQQQVVVQMRLPARIQAHHTELQQRLQRGLGMDVQIAYREEDL